LLELVGRPDIADGTGWDAVNQVLDTADLARYVSLNYWAGNTDWAHQNWYATYRAGHADGRWRFHSWDAEHTLKDPHENVTGKDDPGGPTHLHQRLMLNPAYRELFAETVNELFASDGLLDPGKVSALYRQRLSEIDRAVRAESARWGDNRRRRPYTRGDDWVAERDRLPCRYFPTRTAVVHGQFRDAGWIH
jgi:hypothetical protein